MPDDGLRNDAVRRLRAGDLLLEDHVWQEDFESGTTAGWESYPPFEDTAYDFTLFPGWYIGPEEPRGGIMSSGEAYPLVGVAPPRYSEGSRFYLLRAYRPDGMHGRQIGFWCKTPTLWSREELSLEFDYWLEDRLGTASIEVHIAGGNGVRYIARREAVRREWTHLRLERADFRSEGGGDPLPPDTAIDAVAVVMDLAQADPTAYAYLAIDNVSLRGRRPLQPEYTNPDTHRYRHWPAAMLEKVLPTTAPFEIGFTIGAGLTRASLRLVHALEPAHAHEMDLLESGGRWGLQAPLAFRTTDPSGPWTAEISGEDAQGGRVYEELRFWRLPPSLGPRPRLFVDEDGLRELRERAPTDPAYQALASRAAGGRTELPPREPGFDVYMEDYLLQEIGEYFEAVRVPCYAALENAWVYQVEGNGEAGAFAREVLLRMAGWKRWVHPNFDRLGRRTYYLVGIVTLNLAITYDLVYDLLTPAEREVIRNGMMEKAIEAGWEEYFLHNRIASNTSNWINGTTAGPLVAVLSLFDEPDAFPREFFGLAEKWFAHLRASFLADGSYGEGYGYQSFASYMSAPAFAALSHCFRVPGLVSFFHWLDSNLFNMYIRFGERAMLDMGDSYDTIRPTTHLSWLARETGDPLINGFYQLAPGDDWRSFLWRPREGEGAAPDDQLPPSRVFPQKGSVVFRTGWEPGATVLHFRAGPNFNHTHADQGHFLLCRNGEPLAIEAGKSHYYDNPFYWSFYIHAGAHNVLLVDDNPHSQEIGDFRDEVPAFSNHACLLGHCHDGRAGLVCSDLGPVYRGKLRRYERMMAFTPGGNLVVWDDVETDGTPRLLETLYNPPVASQTTLGDGHFDYTGERARLAGRVLLPKQPHLAMRKVPTYLGEMRKNPDPHSPGTRSMAKRMETRSVVSIGPGEPVTSATFLVAYLPSPAENSRQVQISPIEVESGMGLVLKEEESQMVLLPGGGDSPFGKVESDARLIMIEGRGDELRKVWVLGATHLRIGSDGILNEQWPVDGVYLPQAGGGWASQE